jgi:hypothetical protein
MSTKIKVLFAVFIVAGVMLASAVVANAKTGGEKNGWGFGDQNHVHVGPPGTSVFPN